MGWFEDTFGLYPNPPTTPDIFIPGGSPPWKASGIYGNLRGWNAPPTFANVTKYLYPVGWLLQMQAYVRALLDHKPPPTAPVEEQVYWSLMLMSSVSNGMWAFNANDLVWGLACYGNYEAAMFNETVTTSQACSWVGTYATRGITPLASGVSADLVNLIQGRNTAAGAPGAMPLMLSWRRAYEEGAGTSGSNATNAWPQAPFLAPPLVLDHLSSVYHFEGFCGKHNTIRASWWNNWISEPKSMHCPWAQQGWHLMSDAVPLSLVARGSSKYDESGWEFKKLYADERANNWFVSKMAALPDGSREELFVRLWKFMAFSYRHLNAGDMVSQFGVFETPSSLPRAQNGYIPTLDDIIYEAKLSRGLVPAPFPLYSEITTNAGTTIRTERVNFDSTFDFAKAYDSGAYDNWGRWFADIDMPSFNEALFALYIDYCGQGYIDQAKSDKAGNTIIGRSLVSHDDWDEIEKAKRLSKLSDWLGPLAVVVDFVIGVVTLNVAAILGAFVSAVELAIDRGKAKGMMPWQYTYEMPQGFLRSLNREVGEAGNASLDTAHGSTDKVLTRLGNTAQDTTAAIQQLWPSTDVVTDVEQPTQRPPGEPPPSQGGAPAATKKPPPPPFLVVKKGIDWMRVALWTGVVAVAGYGTWRVLTPAQKTKVRTTARKATAPVTRSKPYQKVKKTTAPYRAKVRQTASKVSSKARSAATTVKTRARRLAP